MSMSTGSVTTGCNRADDDIDALEQVATAVEQSDLTDEDAVAELLARQAR